jgi:hypothetical protein
MASAFEVGMKVDRATNSAAILAAHQRERFLGTIDPSGPQPGYSVVAPPTGQSVYSTERSTVNSTIYSQPTPVITSGTGPGGHGGIFIGSASTGATTAATTGTTAAATIGATTGTTTPSTVGATAATSAATNTSLATPTTAATTATPGQFAAGATVTSTAVTAGATNTSTLTPTLTSSVTPSPTAAANPALGRLRVSQATTTTPTTASSTTTTSASGRVVAPIRVVQGTNGSVTVTNVSTAPMTIKNH